MADERIAPLLEPLLAGLGTKAEMAEQGTRRAPAPANIDRG
jgi:hypothetical protein